MNVKREVYDYTSNNWGHWNSNTSLKKTLEDIQQIHYKKQMCWAYRTQNGQYCSPKLEALAMGITIGSREV